MYTENKLSRRVVGSFLSSAAHEATLEYYGRIRIRGITVGPTPDAEMCPPDAHRSREYVAVRLGMRADI
jgi:hypothetical protein